MAYGGRIAFLDIDFGAVEWADYVHGTPGAPDLALELRARELRVDAAVLKERAVLDTETPDALEDSWRCVVLGTRNTDNGGDGAASYVLLIRPVTRGPLVPQSGQPLALYERVGVASLLASHLLSEETPALLV